MKILQLRRKDRELFLDMDPLFMMERLEFPGAFALAAVMEQEETGEDIPAGLVICMDTGSSIVIQWLCVAARYRRKGIGERLLAAVYDAAVQSGYTIVCAYINTEYGRELVCTGEEAYLRERLFKETRLLAGEWVTDIRTIQNASLLDGRTEKVNVMPLRALSPGRRLEALRFLAGRKYAVSLYPIEDNLEYLDADVSYLLYEGSRLTGGLLIQSIDRIITQLQGDTIRNCTEKVLYPVCMSIESATGMRTLLDAVLTEAGVKYAADSEVHILMKKGTYAPLMERILPNSRIDSKLLVASVEDYQRQDQDFEFQVLLSLG